MECGTNRWEGREDRRDDCLGGVRGRCSRRALLGFALGQLLGAEFARGAAPDRDKALKTCRALQARIERYTRLRRSGAKAQQMERWRTSRRKSSDEFRRLRCRRFGRELRTSK